MLAAPLPTKLADAIFAGALFLKSLPRAKPRFCAAGPNLHILMLTVLGMTDRSVGDNAIQMHNAHPSRNLFCEAKEIRELLYSHSANSSIWECIWGDFIGKTFANMLIFCPLI